MSKHTIAQHISIEEVAKRLQMHPSTVRRKIEVGELGPVRKFGRRLVRLPESAVEEYVRRHTIIEAPR